VRICVSDQLATSRSLSSLNHLASTNKNKDQPIEGLQEVKNLCTLPIWLPRWGGALKLVWSSLPDSFCAVGMVGPFFLVSGTFFKLWGTLVLDLLKAYIEEKLYFPYKLTTSTRSNLPLAESNQEREELLSISPLASDRVCWR